MRKMLSLFLALFLAFPALGQTPEKDFNQANAAYEAGNYEEALKQFESLAKSHESAALYYNAGNAAWKSDRLPLAILYYEKALKLDPADEDIQANLKFANQRVSDKLAWPYRSKIALWLDGFIYGRRPGFWVMFSIFVLFGVCIFLALNKVLKNHFQRRLNHAFIGMSCMAFMVVLIFAGMHHRHLYHNPQGIIFSPVVNARSAPDNDGTEVFVLHVGSKVQIEEVRNGWTRIALPNGTEGWVKETDIRSI